MNVPTEFVVFLLGGNMAVLSLLAHIGLSILRSTTQLDKRLSLVEYAHGLRPQTATQE